MQEYQHAIFLITLAGFELSESRRFDFDDFVVSFNDGIGLPSVSVRALKDREGTKTSKHIF